MPIATTDAVHTLAELRARGQRPSTDRLAVRTKAVRLGLIQLSGPNTASTYPLIASRANRVRAAIYINFLHKPMMIIPHGPVMLSMHLSRLCYDASNVTRLPNAVFPVRRRTTAQIHIFVSHSHEDKSFADALVDALREAGADVWYDERNLATGLLLDEIQHELRSRPVFIVVLSKAAFASDWVRRECRWGWNLYQRQATRVILPVVASTIDHGDFDDMLFLEDFTRIEGPGDQPYVRKEAIERTLRHLALTPVVNPPLEDLLAGGRAHLTQGELPQAWAFYTVATEVAPAQVDAWCGLAHTLCEQKKWEDGLLTIDRALGLDDKCVDAWNIRVWALNALQQYGEALKACDAAEQLAPHDLTMWNNRIWTLNLLSEFDAALTACEAALAIDKMFITTWRNKAWTLHNMGKNEEALEAERRVRELSE